MTRTTSHHLPRHDPKSKAICLCAPMSCGPARAWLPEGRALYKGIMCFIWRPSPQPQAQMEAVSCYNEFVMLLHLFPLCLLALQNSANPPKNSNWASSSQCGGSRPLRPPPQTNRCTSSEVAITNLPLMARNWELHLTCL